jgi:hypothetical protein
MDPITTILTALIAGTAKAAGETVPDAYKGLKALIQKKFVGKPAAEMILNEHEKDSETYAAPLKKNLVEAGVDKDEEILKAAKELLEQLKTLELASGASKQAQVSNNATVTANGARSVAVGGNVSGSNIVTGDGNIVR